MKITGKTFVVTGAAGGIGQQLALQLIDRGASVAAVDYNHDALHAAFERVPDNDLYSLHIIDVSDYQQVEALPDAVIAAHGQIDVLINNAGVSQPFVTTAELSIADMQHVMNVNWWGTVYMTKAFLPFLLDRDEAHIANISSMGGYLPVQKQTIYGASKAAIKTLTEGLMLELGDTNVSVSVVHPGLIDTKMIEEVQGNDEILSSLRKNGKLITKPDDAAKAIIKGIQANASRILVGNDSKLIDKLYRLSPVKTSKFLARVMQRMDNE